MEKIERFNKKIQQVLLERFNLEHGGDYVTRERPNSLKIIVNQGVLDSQQMHDYLFPTAKDKWEFKIDISGLDGFKFDELLMRLEARKNG